MEAKIYNIIAKQTKSKYSLKVRVNYLMSLYRNMESDANDLSFLNDTKRVMSFVNTSDNQGTQKNRLYHIVAVIKGDPDKVVSKQILEFYRKKADKLKEITQEEAENNVMNDKQAGVHVSMNDANTRLENHLRELYQRFEIEGPISPIKDDDFNRLLAIPHKRPNIYTFAKGLQELVLPALYVWQPALRNDWGELTITYKKIGIPSTGNWIQIRPDKKSGLPMMTVLLRDYKTAKHYGPQKIEVQLKLRQLLNIWIQLLERLTGKHTNIPLLYYSINGKGEIKANESKNTFGQALKRASEKIFGKAATINTLRHSSIMNEFANDRRDNFAELTVREKAERAKTHLHSFKTNQQYNLLRRS
jgi:hypothetical protein